MPNIASSRFPLRDLWLPALPFLPLVALTILISPLLDPDRKLDFLLSGKNAEGLTFASEIDRHWIHLGDMLVYYSLSSFHVVICFGVVFYFLVSIRNLPRTAYRKCGVFLAIILMLLAVLAVYYTRNASDIVLVQLGFKAVCMVIKEAGLATDLTTGLNLLTGKHEPTCYYVAFNKLTLLSWIPAFSGMATCGFAAAFAYGSASALPAPDDPDWRASVERRIKALQSSVYALSAVLVSSTLTITLFAHLPVGLLEDGSSDARAVSAYATGISTFWGALFSLTLVATAAAPAFRILRHAYGHRVADEAPADSSADRREWLQEHVFVSLRRQVANVLSLLAPLFVGPLGSLLSSLAGA